MPNSNGYIFIIFLLLIITRSEAQSPVAPSYGLWTLDISHDDKYIATGGDDSLLKIYTSALKLFKVIKMTERGMIRNVSWHPKENLLGVTTLNSVWIMNPETGEEILLEGMPDGARGAGWNYNGELYAATVVSGMVWIWNRQGKLLRKIHKVYANGKKDTRDFLAMDWHPSQNIFVTVGDDIRIFDTSGRQLNMFSHRKQQAGILSVKWHLSGEFFVTGDYGHPNEGIKTLLQFWRPDGTLIKEWAESKGEFRNIRWNKQGTMLATGSDALRIWSAKGELLHTGQPNGSVLWGIDWTSNSGKIFTVSFDRDKGSIRLWNNKAKLLATYRIDQ